MIVVIADDLSGAAELAGAARRLGLTAEVQTRFTADVPAQVVCVDSGGRALPPTAAADGMDHLIRQVLAATPDWVYLKFDSVLRGNILAELRSALAATGQKRALLITANPSRGRIIRGGDYHVDGVPLHETSFATDPEYPTTTSSVRELLGHPAEDIATPDVADAENLAAFAAGAGHDTLTAGSAEFFEALLRARNPGLGASDSGPGTPSWLDESADQGLSTLLVCGSLAAWPNRCDEARERGVRIFDIDDDPNTVRRTLHQGRAALLGIGDRVERRALPPAALVARLADVAAAVIETMSPDRLLLEGGATAAATVRRMGWTRLTVFAGVGPGVGVLKPHGRDGPTLLIKPGSYPWPAGVW